MKTRALACIFLLPVAMAMALCSYAQQRGVVGVGIILKPIQTIQVGTVGSPEDTLPIVPTDSLIDGHLRQVADFGTSMYGISVDRVSADSLAALRSEAVGRKPSANRQKDTALPDASWENMVRAGDSRTLVFYSIRVH